MPTEKQKNEWEREWEEFNKSEFTILMKIGFWVVIAIACLVTVGIEVWKWLGM